MKNILPIITIVAGLATGCGGKNESPDTQKQVLAATNTCISVKQMLFSLQKGEIEPSITKDAQEVIVQMQSSNIIDSVTSLGIVARHGKNYHAPVEASPTSMIKSRIANILTKEGIAGCIINNAHDTVEPLFFEENFTPSKQLANTVNGRSLNGASRFIK